MPDADELLNHPLTAAAAGSFVGMLFARQMTWPQAILAWLAGTLCAHYLAPAVVGYFDIAARSPLATAFVVGAFGLQVVAIAYDALKVARENPGATLGMIVDILLKRKDLAPKDAKP